MFQSNKQLQIEQTDWKQMQIVTERHILSLFWSPSVSVSWSYAAGVAWARWHVIS